MDWSYLTACMRSMPLCAKGMLKRQLKRYLSPALLILDEVGYLPIDQRGAGLLFQVISQRYERDSIVITANEAFKQWPANL
jgi:DNA replication protein DnaC